MSERERLEQSIAALEAQRAVLGDVVVDTALASLKEKLKALEKHPTEQQRKYITVLFADVSGFTAMSETLDPEEVSDIMNALWQRLDVEITGHGGYIDKHIGDAVMALWGAEIAHEDDPQQAIKAALAMQAAIKEFTAQRPDIALQMRIGLNTGPVLLGQVGITAEFTAMGDTVNLASRLEHAAPVGGILISHNTYHHVRGIFDVLEQAPLTVKGKAEPIQTYVVQRLKPRAFRMVTRGVEGIETRMIGRQTELRHLQDAHYTIFEDGELQVVTIYGEAGIGKSRLLYEFEKWSELQPENFRLFKARANQQTQGMPYFLIRDLFAFRFEIAESDSAEVVCSKFVAGVAGFMGTESEKQAHFMGYMLGYPFGDSPYLHGIRDDLQQIHNIALHYLAQFFTAITRIMPVHILLEDIHWADDGSLEVIQHLMQTCRELPILIVCLARPELFERCPLWGEGQEQHTRLELRSLSKRETRHLVGEILQRVTDLPPDLRDLIVSHTEGNPFYVEEVIKVLLEDGIIVKDTQEQWRVAPTRLADVQVPPTLTGVLEARLDALPEPEREVLKRASVAGQIFWDRIVTWLYQDLGGVEVTPEGINEILALLRAKELIFGRGHPVFAGMQEYIFKHALLRDATYETVLLRQRRRYHAQAAQWLIKQSGERVGQYAGLIGEHYEKAQQPAPAARWYGQAGKQAQDAYAPDTAIDYYQRALNLLDNVRTSEVSGTSEIEAQRLQIYEGLGTVLYACARYTEAFEAFSAMRTVAEVLDDARAQARAWWGLSSVQDDQGDNRAALTSAGQAEAVARQADPAARTELAGALYMKGWELSRLGKYEQALVVAEEALSLSTVLANPMARIRSLNLLAEVNKLPGRYKTAADYQEQALDIARAQGNREREATMLNNLGETFRGMGANARAISLYQAALSIAREISERSLEWLLLSNIGGMRVELGDCAAAEAELRQIIEQVDEEETYFLPQTYADLAIACLRQDKIEAAFTAAQQALSLAQSSESPEYLGWAWRVMGQVVPMVSSGPIGEPEYTAAECFAESVRIYEESGMAAEQAKTLKVWAEYELKQGDRAKGEAMWQEARAIFERLELSLLLEQMAPNQS